MTETIEALTRAVGETPWPLLGAASAAIVVSLCVRTVRRCREAHAAQVFAWISARLTFIVGGAGVAVASYGVVMFLRSVGLPWLVAILGSVLIEGGILTLTVKMYEAIGARRSHSATRNLAWLFVAASAWANITHPPGGTNHTGALVFGAFPVLGAVLIEFHAWTTGRRTAQRSDSEERVLPRLLRACWCRLWAAAAARLGVDIHARDTDVERWLRARKAARQLHRLQQADQGSSALARWQASRLEVRARRALMTANAPADTEMHRQVLRTRRMSGAVRDMARDRAPSEPWDPAPPRLARQHEPGPPSAAAQQRGRTKRSRPAATGQDTGPRQEATQPRPSSSRRTNRKTRNRTSPDVSDLIEAGQAIYLNLRRSGQPLNRDRFLKAMREAGHALSTDRATALWRELNNGRAPAPTRGQ